MASCRPWRRGDRQGSGTPAVPCAHAFPAGGASGTSRVGTEGPGSKATDARSPPLKGGFLLGLSEDERSTLLALAQVLQATAPHGYHQKTRAYREACQKHRTDRQGRRTTGIGEPRRLRTPGGGGRRSPGSRRSGCLLRRGRSQRDRRRRSRSLGGEADGGDASRNGNLAGATDGRVEDAGRI